MGHDYLINHFDVLCNDGKKITDSNGRTEWGMRVMLIFTQDLQRRAPMTYIDGFIIAVPKANRQKFIDHATTGDSFFVDLGAVRVVECWEDDVPDGTTTDFRMAVKATADEDVVFSWVEWPDKETRDKAHAIMMAPDFNDPRLDPAINPMPYDGKRMIYGGFVPVVETKGKK
jgi:uncharacterized protein YbaA (DUF1428 family)